MEQFKPTHLFMPFERLEMSIPVILTGVYYKIGQHPVYKDFNITECQDKKGNLHDAFDNEIYPLNHYGQSQSMYLPKESVQSEKLIR